MKEKIPSEKGDSFEEREKPKAYYHGSKYPLGEGEEIERRKATAPEGRPAEEDMDVIYLTPDFEVALAMAARPEGITEIDHNAKTIHFENPDSFDPNKEVYVYEIDSSIVPEDKITEIDLRQISVDVDEIKPEKVMKVKAGDLKKYYKIV